MKMDKVKKMKTELEAIVECVSSCRLLEKELKDLGRGWDDDGPECATEFWKEVKDIELLAGKYHITLDDEQLGFVMFAINRFVDDEDVRMLEFYERDLEMVCLILSLHSNVRLKIGKVDCKYLYKDLKVLMLEDLAMKVASEYSVCCDQCRVELLGKIKSGDVTVLNEMKTEVEGRVRMQKKLVKESNRLKELARAVSFALHPDYMEYKRGLPKKSVCFIFDLLVYCGAKEDNGFTADDDKYDALKRFFKKSQISDEFWFED